MTDTDEVRAMSAAARLGLHDVVTDGQIIGIVTRRQGSSVHVLVGMAVTHFGRYGNTYEDVVYGYGNYGADLEPLGYTLAPVIEAVA